MVDSEGGGGRLKKAVSGLRAGRSSGQLFREVTGTIQLRGRRSTRGERNKVAGESLSSKGVSCWWELVTGRPNGLQMKQMLQWRVVEG